MGARKLLRSARPCRPAALVKVGVALSRKTGCRLTSASPTLVRSRSIVSSRASRARDFRPADPASRKASRQPLRAAAVTAELARHDLQRLTSQEPQHRVPLATRRHPPLPARSRGRSDIRGLRARGSSALNLIHPGTSISAQLGRLGCLSEP